MKSKSLGVILSTALALIGFTGTASATTLELKGVKQTGAVAIRATLKTSTSSLISDTSGTAFHNTCTASTIEGKSATFTGTTVSVQISLLTLENCTESPPVIDEPGIITIENNAGTTNGTVRWTGLKVTVPSPFGIITCSSGASPGTDANILTGVTSGSATFDLKAIILCGVVSTKWEATYVLTTPEALGVTS